ncbi:MAG: hypothetical protein SOZ80_01795 [Prevotella sp.]|nr:hypothetical protein [Prevotella sp.]MDD7317402.1 hypothetical protein [Prevotellaceae bacterium]MDY4019500.1 hypothetical protein [Prevotella sp.]
MVEMLKGENIPIKSITTDNGTEFAAHEIIARELNQKTKKKEWI